MCPDYGQYVPIYEVDSEVRIIKSLNKFGDKDTNQFK